MSSIVSINLSAARVAETQLQAAASNLANIRTTETISSSGEDAFSQVEAVRKDLSDAALARSASFPGRGENVSLATINGGLITQPTIDRAIEVISALVARYDFASGKVVRTGVDLGRIPVDRPPIDKVA